MLKNTKVLAAAFIGLGILLGYASARVNFNPAGSAWARQPAPTSRIEPKEQTLVAPDQPDRTVLPKPEGPFKGKVETYLLNST
jgi:hypothetical protein